MHLWDTISRWIWGSNDRHEAPPSYSSLPRATPSFPYDYQDPLLPSIGSKPPINILPSSRRDRLRGCPGSRKYPAGETDRYVDGNICITFTQNGFAEKICQGQGWVAVLHLRADDVPRLLREGLFWTEENLDKETGYIEHNPQSTTSPHFEPPYVRAYFLRDLSEEHRWTGRLLVYCNDFVELSQFRFCDLRVDQICHCAARDGDKKVVYVFQRAPDSIHCVNTLYDDMPLDGWWPWPKTSNTNKDSTSLI